MNRELFTVVAATVIIGSLAALNSITPVEIPAPAVVTIADPNLSDALDCVVYIRAGNAEGSGCFVSIDGIVLTARHVIQGIDANDITVTLRNGLSYKATAVYASPTAGPLAGPDVGFLKVDYYHPMRWLALEPDIPPIGDPVWCLGHPYGKGACPWTLTRGIVSSTDRDCKGAFGPGVSYQIDAASYPGNSGGPVIDSHGCVVGVLVGSYEGRESLGVCVPAGRIVAWLGVFRTMLGTQP